MPRQGQYQLLSQSDRVTSPVQLCPADVSADPEIPPQHGGQQRQRRQQGAPGQLQEGRRQCSEEDDEGGEIYRPRRK